MPALPHIPALRLGRPYASLDRIEVKDCRSGEPLLAVSQVNAGIVRRDLAKTGASREALAQFSCGELIALATKAGELFLNGTLPLGDDGATQSPQEYVEMLSATSGLPHVLVRRNMARIHSVLTNLDTILCGLTRGLDLGVIDSGLGRQAGATVSFCAVTDALGVVMPSNSPAVNSLWLPAVALKIPVMLKPGREEPLTPWRLIQAFIAAGVPAEAFGFYPTEHDGAGEVLRGCGRALLFGDKSVADQYANNPAVEVHGPGYSKIVIGEDEIAHWAEHLDVIVESIAANGGRSCLNASAVVVPSHADELADALAQRLGPIEPRAMDDENAALSAFANPKMAELIDAAIEEDLKSPGAREATASHRGGPRKVERDGATYLRPTIVRCDSFSHPLANREFLFPYASVVEVPQDRMADEIGHSLVVSAITRDDRFIARLMKSPGIDRLNIGPVSTMKVAWDQPHEGNLFEFLYRRRSVQRADE